MLSKSYSFVNSAFRSLLESVNDLKTALLVRRRITAGNSAMPSSTSLRPSPPTAIPLREIIVKLPRLFPRSAFKSLRDFEDFKRNPNSLQHELLSTLPFFPRPNKEKVANIVRTPVDNEGNYINEFCIEPRSRIPGVSMKHLILIHGYGAGLGFYLKSLERINFSKNDWCIHAIDLPGYGFSSRPRFPFEIGKHSAETAENWFHDRFNQWLRNRGLLEAPESNMVVAHSMGAYLSALYANRHPNHFKKLIMCSPAGICESSAAMRKKIPPWWFQRLWDKNFSPFSLVRKSGYLGSKLTSGWSYRRFKRFLYDNDYSRTQHEAMHRYTYSIFNQRGSGEYLLSFALKCGGEPRKPLEKRLFHNISDQFKASCQWLWLYGDQDWMDRSGGERVSDFLQEMGLKSAVETVPSAGHHLYLDNYQVFNKILEREMADF